MPIHPIWRALAIGLITACHNETPHPPVDAASPAPAAVIEPVRLPLGARLLPNGADFKVSAKEK
jgi:hypothetical protein